MNIERLKYSLSERKFDEEFKNGFEKNFWAIFQVNLIVLGVGQKTKKTAYFVVKNS